MKILIKESQKNQVLFNLIEKEGWDKASEVFNGYPNLINIIGRDNLLNYFMSYFDNLRLYKLGRSLFVSQNYDDLIEKPSSFWSSDIRAYDSGFRITLKDVPKLVYSVFREDIIKQIISKFPELMENTTGVDVYEDNGLYKKYDSFKLDRYQDL